MADRRCAPSRLSSRKARPPYARPRADFRHLPDALLRGIRDERDLLPSTLPFAWRDFSTAAGDVLRSALAHFDDHGATLPDRTKMPKRSTCARPSLGCHGPGGLGTNELGAWRWSVLGVYNEADMAAVIDPLLSHWEKERDNLFALVAPIYDAADRTVAADLVVRLFYRRKPSIVVVPARR